MNAIALAAAFFLLAAVTISIALHRHYAARQIIPPSSSLARCHNLLLCVDCAGHHRAHEPWCGRDRPRDYQDPREVLDGPKRKRK